MDIEARVVLHPVSIAGAVIGLADGWYSWGLVSRLLGGLFGFCFMYVIYWIGIKLSRYTAKKRGEEIEEEPMGFGDVNLSGVLGLTLGWPGVVAGLMLGILAGGAFSLLFIIQKMISKEFKLFQTIPYAPFLVIGAVIIILIY
jgi:leader peptidase (prepilin peptidase)/N-methyltransferase